MDGIPAFASVDAAGLEPPAGATTAGVTSAGMFGSDATGVFVFEPTTVCVAIIGLAAAGGVLRFAVVVVVARVVVVDVVVFAGGGGGAVVVAAPVSTPEYKRTFTIETSNVKTHSLEQDKPSCLMKTRHFPERQFNSNSTTNPSVSLNVH